MSLRAWIDKNSALVTIAAMVVLVLALGYSIVKLTGIGGGSVRFPDSSYFYDLNTGEIFIGPSTMGPGRVKPPVEAPSGFILDGKGKEDLAGFQAMMYTCGECPENMDGWTAAQIKEAEVNIFLEYWTKEAREREKKHGPMPMLSPYDYESGQRVAQVPDEPGTFPRLLSPERGRGGRLISKSYRCPGTIKSKACTPPQ